MVSKTLFDPAPKDNPRFLYGRDRELAELASLLEKGEWAVLMGPRRVGKTSLALSAAALMKVPTVAIDSRIDADLSRALTVKLSKNVRTTVGGNISVPPVGIGLLYSRESIDRTLDSLLSKVKGILVILDEAQWLSNPRRVDMILSHIFDYHHEKVTFIITGSAVGVMKSIIDPGVRNPLYGRSITQMRVGKWMDSSTSINFLREGCRQNGMTFKEEEMAEVAGKLGGMPGWLTLFGHQYAISGDTRKALRTVRSQAMRIVREELENASKVAMGWERELRILKEIRDGGRRFSELQDRFNMGNTPLSRNLQMLMRLEYVEKDVSGRYVVSDPMVEEYLRKFRTTDKSEER